MRLRLFAPNVGLGCTGVNGYFTMRIGWQGIYQEALPRICEVRLNKKEVLMDKEQSSKLIKDLTFDINDLHDAWYDKKIDDALAIEKIVNLCFYSLRTVIDDATK